MNDCFLKPVYFDGSPTRIAVYYNEEGHIFQNNATGPLEIEYLALIKTLELLSDDFKYVIYSDNQSLVARMNCDHELPKSQFDKFHSQVIEIIKSKNLDIRMKWVPRKQNTAGKMI